MMLEEWRTVNLAGGGNLGNISPRFLNLFLTYQSHSRAPPIFVLSSLFDVLNRAFPRKH